MSSFILLEFRIQMKSRNDEGIPKSPDNIQHSKFNSDGPRKKSKGSLYGNTQYIYSKNVVRLFFFAAFSAIFLISPVLRYLRSI